MELPTLYRDDATLVIDKPSGWLVHNSSFTRTRERTVLTVVRESLGDGWSPVHRLDRGTSGVLLLSRGAELLRAWQESLAGGGKRAVRVSARSAPGDIRVLGSVESSHGDPRVVTELVSRLGLGGGVVKVDSQVKYGVLARGDGEVYLRPRSSVAYRENVWDHAAGAAIAAAAGGRVTDTRGAPLDFRLGKKLERNEGVLATNGPMHDAIVKALS